MSAADIAIVEAREQAKHAKKAVDTIYEVTGLPNPETGQPRRTKIAYHEPVTIRVNGKIVFSNMEVNQ